MTDNQTSRQKRKGWIRKLLSLARSRGDKRPRRIIIEELESRSAAISRAFSEAHEDGEIRETVVNKGCHYPAADLHEGEVLTRGLVYAHPVLMLP